MAAPQALCFEVVAAAGRVKEKRSDIERVVEFTSDFKGREVVTVELVRLEPPDRIRYQWLEGPLPYVEEQISFEQTGSDTTDLVYEGRFAVSRGLGGWMVGRLWIKRHFDRLVLEHLEYGKEVAERRAERSRVHGRK